MSNLRKFYRRNQAAEIIKKSVCSGVEESSVGPDKTTAESGGGEEDTDKEKDGEEGEGV